MNVENAIGLVMNTWRKFQYGHNNKALETNVAAQFFIAVHLSNIKTIIEGGNLISRQYNIQPPSLAEYMSMF